MLGLTEGRNTLEKPGDACDPPWFPLKLAALLCRPLAFLGRRPSLDGGVGGEAD